MLVTVLGWIAIVGGLIRILFPIQLATLAAGLGQNIGMIGSVAVVLLVVGAFLSFKGFTRD